MNEPGFMRRALALAAKGRGYVEPNPMVGCVVVRDGRIVAEGYHRRFGGMHAEVEALEDCRRKGVDAAGCDFFVTLEPCAHHGKTPPCVDALIAARPARVVAAMVDPFAKVAGEGLRRLREAGVAVESGLCEDEARRLNGPYLKRLEKGLPWIIAKWAQTLDGRLALAPTPTGRGRWISNEKSRRHAHTVRARIDALVVGIGTVLADDPQLTARGVRVRRVARRVVVDPDLRLPDEAQLLREPGPPLTVGVRSALMQAGSARLTALESRGVEFVGLRPSEADPTRVELDTLFRHLSEQHAATNVVVEGGAILLGEVFRQRLVDQAMVYIAPTVGGAMDSVSTPAVRVLSPTAPPMYVREIRRFGEDVMIDYGVGG